MLLVLAAGCLSGAGLIFALQGSLGTSRGGPQLVANVVVLGSLIALAAWIPVVRRRLREGPLPRLLDQRQAVALGLGLLIVVGRVASHERAQRQAEIAAIAWLIGSGSLAAFLGSLFVLPAPRRPHE